MGIKFKFRNLAQFEKSLDTLATKIDNDPSLLEKIGQAAVAFIKTRTLSGIDAEGSSFKPYVPQYEEFRRKKGRTSSVNLSFSGRMLASLFHSIIGKRKVRIAFSRSEEGEKAFYNAEHGREILGLTPEEENKIQQMVDDWLEDLVKRF